MDLRADLSGRKVTVMGLGLFGGGAGVTRYLIERGASVTVTDLRTEVELARGLKLIDGLPVRRVFGRHDEADFRDADLVIVNPAVPPGVPMLRLAEAEGVRVETEMNLTLRLLGRRPVLGVTGSNGKTTTAHLAWKILAGTGRRAWLGGNMGGSLLPKITEMGEDDPVVLELSSFQLERSAPEGLGPDVGIVTNLTPNHLDRHGTFGRYVDAKAGLFVRARAGVINLEDEASRARFDRLDLPVAWFSSERAPKRGIYLDGDQVVERFRGEDRVLFQRDAVRLPGLFNLENLMAALTGARLLLNDGPLPREAAAAGAAFAGVPHRLETVVEARGVRYVNDSIATTPESSLAALSAIDGEIHLIAGGYDKGLPLEAFGEGVARCARGVYLIGTTAEAMERSIVAGAARLGVEGPRVMRCPDLESAVHEAAAAARTGVSANPVNEEAVRAVVLLSPGFASWDQFLNFEVRGERFRDAARACATIRATARDS